MEMQEKNDEKRQKREVHVLVVIAEIVKLFNQFKLSLFDQHLALSCVLALIEKILAEKLTEHIKLSETKDHAQAPEDKTGTGSADKGE